MDIMAYETTAYALVERISALIPEHPEILNMTSPWDLFNVPGFNCKDIGPSLAQAWIALSKAKLIYKQTTIDSEE